MRIRLNNIYVGDVDGAFQFYTEVLGFVEKIYVPDMQLAIVVSPEDRDGTALLLEPNANPIAKAYQETLYQAGLPPLVFVVKDIQTECERLQKLGVVFRQTPTKTDWGIQALLEDTCGNLIQLHQANEV